jgi:integrase/recombinase XerC
MLLERFVDHLTYEKRYSPHTVSAYHTDLQQFQAFLASFGVSGLEAATDRTVRAWMMQLMEQGIGARSVNRKLSSLRGFYRFARLVGSVPSSPQP